MRFGSNSDAVEVPVAKITIITLLCIALFVLLLVGGCSAAKSYSRYQKRADAQNAVRVTSINVKRMRQQARVVAAQDQVIRALADQRVIKAEGIRKAQDKIQATLTPLYVQFEAIEAQKAIATSGQNNTVVYVPSGTNGTPVITADAVHGK
jgi:hypothetical protein